MRTSSDRSTAATARTTTARRNGAAAPAKQAVPKQAAPKKQRSSSARGSAVTPDGSASGDGQAVDGSERSRIGIATSDAITRPLKTSELVARDVAHDIIARRLTTGDNLPSEAAMLEHYGVSRESLREGLRLLEVQGLISIRRGPGGGPIVGTIDPANLGRVSTLYYHMAGATYRELFEAWIISEGILAGRAARNPDTELRRSFMQPYVVDPDKFTNPEQLDAYMQAQLEFHAKIATLGQNRVLELSLQVFGQIVSHHFALESDPRHIHSSISQYHRDLAEAVIAGKPARATAIMVEHLEYVAEVFFATMGDGVDDYIEWR